MQYHVLSGQYGGYIIVDDKEIKQSEIQGHSQAWWFREGSFDTETEALSFRDELIDEDTYVENIEMDEWFNSLSECDE